MRTSRWALIGLAAGLLGALTLGVPAQTQEPTAPRRPDWRRDYAAFQALPPEMQQRIRQLDRELRELDPETQARLLRVMQRYAEWLSRLPPEDRQYIEQAGSTAEKLQRIRELRERQWVATLPKADRDRIDAAPPSERPQLIASLRDRERLRELEWLVMQTYAGDRQEAARQDLARWRDELFAKLTRDERTRLIEAFKTNNRPAQFRLLRELSEKYKVAPPVPLDKLRVGESAYPPVPSRKLLEFLRTQVDPTIRREFEQRFRDPDQQNQALEDLVELYWQHHPQELKRIRDEDLRKRSRTPPR
jgi:hypothetical protein